MAKQFFETTIGGAKVLVEDMSTKSQDYGMRDTAGGSQPPKLVGDLMDRMKPVIAGLAGMGEEALSTLSKRPDEVSMSVNMGYDTELNAWIFKGDASLTFKVEIKWKKEPEAGKDA